MSTEQNAVIATTDNFVSPARKEGALTYEAVYDEFIVWFACPKAERKAALGAETMIQFAEKHQVSERTLTNWKKRADFIPRVRDLRKTWGQERVGEVLDAVYKASVKGNPLAQKLYLQYVDEFSEKTELELKNQAPTFSVDDVRFIIEQLPEPLKSKHYGYIRELLDDATSVNRARLAAANGGELRPETPIRRAPDHHAPDVRKPTAHAVARRHSTGLRADMVGEV